MCSETAFIIFSPDLRIMSCMCSVHKVTLMDPEAAKKPAEISTLCDALMCLGNYFENNWAGPAHMALWTPAPVLLPKNSSPELVPRSRGCCGRHTRDAETQICGWIILKLSCSSGGLTAGENSGENFSSIDEEVGKINQQRNKCCQEGCPFFLPLQILHTTKSSPNTSPPKPGQLFLVALCLCQHRSRFLFELKGSTDS